MKNPSYRPVPAQVDLPALDHEVLHFWHANSVFARSLEQTEGRPAWIFYEGPPTANGMPGTHHIEARVFKDVLPRFQTMRGKHVVRKGGWDCHGLPVEVEVEKELGLTSKADIEAFGVAAFNDRCRASVQRYVSDFTSLTERAGVWIDTEDAYRTLDNSYIESVWWLLRRLWDKGLLYEGHRVSPYCPRCGTALSSHELGQPGVYRDIVDPAVYLRFPVVGGEADLLDDLLAVRPAFLPDRDHRRFVQHDALAAHVDQRVGRAEVDGEVAAEIAFEELEH